MSEDLYFFPTNNIETIAVYFDNGKKVSQHFISTCVEKMQN